LESIIRNKGRGRLKYLVSSHHIGRSFVKINLRALASNNMHLWLWMVMGLGMNMGNILNIAIEVCLELILKWLMFGYFFEIRLFPSILIMLDLYVSELTGDFGISIE
jgi:hypothetical protein